MLSKAHYTCLRQQEPWGVKKKKGCQRRGDNQGFGDEGGIGALQETKERTKKIALGEPGLCQQFPEFIFY